MLEGPMKREFARMWERAIDVTVEKAFWQNLGLCWKNTVTARAAF